MNAEQAAVSWYFELLSRAARETEHLDLAVVAAERAFAIQPLPPDGMEFGWVSTGTVSKGLPGWKNEQTGEYRYQKNQPGTRAPAAPVPTAGAGRPGAPAPPGAQPPAAVGQPSTKSGQPPAVPGRSGAGPDPHNPSDPRDPSKNMKLPWQQTLEEFVSSGGSFFTTDQGSVYAYANGQSVRVKSQHGGHNPRDVGLKKPSAVTYFTSVDHAKEIGMWQSLQGAGEKKVLVQDGVLLLLSKRPGAARHGVDGRIPITYEPAKGVSPVELFEPSQSMPGAYNGNHPGSPILGPADPKAAHALFVSHAGAPGTRAPAAPKPPAASAAQEAPSVSATTGPAGPPPQVLPTSQVFTPSSNEELPDVARPQLGASEVVALNNYTGNQYKPMNQSLRETGAPPTDPGMSRTHQLMQSAFGKAQVMDRPVRVFRGADVPAEFVPEFVGQLQQALASGDTISGQGYASTSVGGFTGGFAKSPVVFEVDAVHGLDLKGLSGFGKENEFLLNHGAKYKVASVERAGEQYKVRLVQQAPTPEELSAMRTQGVAVVPEGGGESDPVKAPEAWADSMKSRLKASGKPSYLAQDVDDILKDVLAGDTDEEYIRHRVKALEGELA